MTAAGDDDAPVVALRKLLRANEPEEVVAAMTGLVRALGGIARPPRGGNDEVPVDITFGISSPLVPTGGPDVLPVLHEVLPPLVEDARIAMQRCRLASHLVENATTDPLTGLANRRKAMRVLSRLRPGDSVVMIDLDLFKVVNDTHGHAAGDAVLRKLADSMRAVLRASDVAGRVGGEEFALLLPHTDVPGALRMIERLREDWNERRPLPVTLSAGVAAVEDEGGAAALTAADHALYLAKRNGRDRVELAGSADVGDAQ